MWRTMCGRIIQSSGPLRYAIVDGMNVRDSRVHNYPPRWNAAPSQELYEGRRALMRMWPISTRVNKPENDDSSIVEPIELTVDVA
jgi:putative SOS response-associated peptidase YedK